MSAPQADLVARLEREADEITRYGSSLSDTLLREAVAALTALAADNERLRVALRSCARVFKYETVKDGKTLHWYECQLCGYERNDIEPEAHEPGCLAALGEP